tara:strand:- start:179 stop:2095 length:1917 start_codon:yes stop_codon:yes gene_type:complete
MSNAKKMLISAAGSAGEQGLDITDVFSTYLWDGISSSQSIVNGIDLDGEGGMAWIKLRDVSDSHRLFDTERGATKFVSSNRTNAESAGGTDMLTSFNNNGFTYSTFANGYDVASWTFRKAPKFFDVVTYTGNGVAGRTVSHNLGTTVGSIFIKQTNTARNWIVYHRGINGGVNPGNYICRLDTTAAQQEYTTFLNDTAPTDSVFSLGTSATVNQDGGTYVAYIFAHNDDDGGFGPDADQDIIKCGSYNGTGAAGNFIDLGFEPQWLLVKRSSGAEDWMLFDSMRGVATGGIDQDLRPNKTNAEGATLDWLDFNATGFTLNHTIAHVNASGSEYIYMAIRRGPLAPPEAGTEVFALQQDDAGSAEPAFRSSFPVDLAFTTNPAGTSSKTIATRLQGAKKLGTHETNAEESFADALFDYMNGWNPETSQGASVISYMWKRAPSFCDIVTYTGNGAAGRTVSHNLGVAPEMIWVKKRSAAASWIVLPPVANSGQKYMSLNADISLQDYADYWNDTQPTSAVFTIDTDNDVNQSSATYISYLFATLAGVSKLGTVTHSGSSTDVDCGFSNGARFVLLKRTDAGGDWYVWDSVRGIVAGNDPYFLFSSSAAQVTNTDFIDPLNAGFTISDDFTDGDYIFYAIA